jgi:hypothetical protein
MFVSIRAAVLPVVLAASASAAELPGRYFQLIDAGARQVETRLAADPNATLESLEKNRGWTHFGYSILAPAVLYAKHHPANPRYHDPKMLALAIRIGDLLASENEKGKFRPRLDSDWDTYTWLEAYRLLEKELGPWTFHGTNRPISERHRTTIRNGRSCRIWQEPLSISRSGCNCIAGPTIGYDHLTLSTLTLSTVAFYWEFSHDPEALKALRRSTDFHMHFTYPDGVPVETMNNRNRYWAVSPWAQFAFSNFPDGRRYAEFLSRFFDPDIP